MCAATCVPHLGCVFRCRYGTQKKHSRKQKSLPLSLLWHASMFLLLLISPVALPLLHQTDFLPSAKLPLAILDIRLQQRCGWCTSAPCCLVGRKHSTTEEEHEEEHEEERWPLWVALLLGADLCNRTFGCQQHNNVGALLPCLLLWPRALLGLRLARASLLESMKQSTVRGYTQHCTVRYRWHGC